jgi:predicted nucleic acid-binding Zn ribbon protein
MKDKDEVKDIRQRMQELFTAEGMPEFEELLRIKTAWVEIVGEDTAEKTRPYRLEKGTLSVGVGSHSQVQDMLFRVEEIKQRTREETGIEIKAVRAKKVNLY